MDIDERIIINPDRVDPRIRQRDAKIAAVNLALRGETDAALARFRELVEGDPALHVPIAELLLFRGRFLEAVEHANAFLATKILPENPDYVQSPTLTNNLTASSNNDGKVPAKRIWSDAGKSVNVVLFSLGYPRSMIQIIVRAGFATGDWPSIRAAAPDALLAVQRMDSWLPIRDMPFALWLAPYLDDERQHAPIEMLTPPGNADKEYLKGDEAETPSWNRVMAQARVLAKIGQYNEAWDYVTKHLDGWMPECSPGWVVPVALLTEMPVDFMTPERCAFIVDNPRGQVAESESTRTCYTAPAETSRDPGIAEWQSKLIELSEAYLKADLKNNSPKLPTALYECAYIGKPGASEDEVQELEARVGKPLPASYRNFLLATDGCDCPEIDELFGIMGHLHSYCHVDEYQGSVEPELRSWGDGKDIKKPIDFPVVYSDGIADVWSALPTILSRSIEIGRVSDDRFMLLSPDITTENGEWLCLLYSTYTWPVLPSRGFDFYRSFGDWFNSEFETMTEIST